MKIFCTQSQSDSHRTVLSSFSCLYPHNNYSMNLALDEIQEKSHVFYLNPFLSCAVFMLKLRILLPWKLLECMVNQNITGTNLPWKTS